MGNKNDDRLKVVPQQDDEQPEVYGMSKGKDGVKLGRRAFLGTLGVGVLASVSGGRKAWAEEEVQGQACGMLKAHSHIVRSVSISPDGAFLASGSVDNTIKLWALPEGKLMTTLTGHSDWVRSIAISPDGTLLASGSNDRTIKLWALPAGEPNRCLFDPVLTEKGTEVRKYRQMGPKTMILPCGSPIPPGATCLCNCVAGSVHYPGTEMVCTCDTIMVPVGTALPAGAVCTCNTVAAGTYAKPTPIPVKPPRSSPGGRICTCDTIHYWYPN